MLRTVCHRHTDVILLEAVRYVSGIGRVWLPRSGPLKWVQAATPLYQAARCTKCKVHPQWNKQKLHDLIDNLPEGVWQVTDVEMNRLINSPDLAEKYLQLRANC